jgi:hypothetical protein
MEDGVLHWSGQVVPGTPVVIQYAVQARGATVYNTAYLDDGLEGPPIKLPTTKPYISGYGVTVNDGALFTPIPTVTMRYARPPELGPTYVRFINPGIGPHGDESGDWITATQAETTHTWRLPAFIDPYAPYPVYAEFPYGWDLWDEINYDPVAPEIHNARTMHGLPPSVTVRVHASDDNSGVDRLQISHYSAFTEYVEHVFSGTTRGVPWLPQPSGEIYVRVVDRAGNLSESTPVLEPYRFFLPLWLRDS